MFHIDNICNNCVEKQINGSWVRARPLSLSGWRRRIRDAWLVLTGKADAVIWTEQ